MEMKHGKRRRVGNLFQRQVPLKVLADKVHGFAYPFAVRHGGDLFYMELLCHDRHPECKFRKKAPENAISGLGWF
jgi:hypothetical protein